MICDPTRELAISSMGWADHDALWTYRKGSIGRIPLESGCRYASLHHDGSGHFAVAHHYDDGTRFQISVRRFEAPAETVAGVVVRAEGSEITGDLAAWNAVPHLFVAFLAVPPHRDFVLVRVEPQHGHVTLNELAWYDGSYDKGYQGVVGCIELPGMDQAVVSVQRSSRLVLHDFRNGNAERFIDLAGRSGNPQLLLRNGGAELWASDYDTMCRVETRNWRVVKKRHLQGPGNGHPQQFIGEFSSTAGHCVVARPFSRDVVELDPHSLRIREVARMPGQPLEAVLLSDEEVVARDWKTGECLRGRFTRKTWWS